MITQDHAADAVELEQVLNNLLPLLRASEPDKLSITLTALADGLQGHGKELGQTLVGLNAYLVKYNQHLPALDSDIKQLAGFARNLNQASPDLIQAAGRLHRHQPDVRGRTGQRLRAVQHGDHGLR